MTVPVSVAIVGSTQAFKVLLPAFRASPAFRVAALCGRDTNKVAQVATECGIPKVYSGWESLLDDPEIEAVALALPAALQAEAVQRLAASGKHLFCEKPMATTVADAERMVAAVQQAGTKAVMNFGFRFVEAFRRFREMAESGKLGKLFNVQVEWLLDTRVDATLTWNWKSDRAMGGGTWCLMASHVLDYLGWFFDGIKAVDLQTTSLVATRPDAVTGLPKLVTAEDTCHALLRVGEYVPASVSISTALPVGGNHRIRAWFEQGRLELANKTGDDYFDGFKLNFQPSRACSRDDMQALAQDLLAVQDQTRERETRVTIARRVVDAFARSLVGDTPTPSLADGLEVQRLLECGLRPSSVLK